MPAEGMSLILAGALISIALNPLLFATIEPVRKWVLARSAFLRYREALGEAIGEIPSGLYPGDYLVPVGEALAAERPAAAGKCVLQGPCRRVRHGGTAARRTLRAGTTAVSLRAALLRPGEPRR